MFGLRDRKAKVMLKMTSYLAEISVRSLPPEHPAFDLLSRDWSNTAYYTKIAAFAFVSSAVPELEKTKGVGKRLFAHLSRRASEEYQELVQWTLLQEGKGIKAGRAAGMWVVKHLRQDDPSGVWDCELSEEEDDLSAQLAEAMQFHLESLMIKLEEQVGVTWLERH